jgi:O-antigen ligase
MLILFFFAVWVMLIRPWNEDWQHGLSDIRDWSIPIISFIILLTTIKRGWRRWALIIICVALLQSCLGIYQVMTDSSRPFISWASLYKMDFLSQGFVSFAVGTFEHPNSLSIFLIIAIMVAIGWMAERDSLKGKLFPVAIIVIMLISLYFTYAKAEILALLLMIFLFVAISHIKSPLLFILLGIFTILIMIGVGWFAINKWPGEFETIWWRIDVWRSAVQTLSESPAILLWGNGDSAYAANSNWPQPHNIYFDALIKYGVVGTAIQIFLFTKILQVGLNAYKRGDIKKSGILRALWVALLGFLITGLVESSFIGIETRMIFLLLTTCFIGLNREFTTMTMSLNSNLFDDKVPE